MLSLTQAAVNDIYELTEALKNELIFESFMLAQIFIKCFYL